MVRWILFSLWFLFMTWLSHAPGDETAAHSSFLYRLLERVPLLPTVPEEQLRRLAHVALFFGFAVLFLSALRQGGRKSRLWLLLPFAFAALDEVTKIPIPGRHCHPVDILLNIAGCAAGIAVYYAGDAARGRFLHNKETHLS